MLLTTTEHLSEFAVRAKQAGSVALDTEFVWTRTFYPYMGIIQAALPDGTCAIIDAVTIQDFSPLARLLEDPAVTKILHDAQQDLTHIRRITGAHACSVFDTRCAAGFVGLGSTISLADLMSRLLGISMTKTERRTDWCQRPLTEDQVVYAMEDVRYLHQARDALMEMARGIGRDGWIIEEQTKYDNPELYDDPDPRQQYLRVKGVGILSPRKLAVARELTAWREQEARRRNRPRSHIFADEAIVSICRTMPGSLEGLQACRGLHGEDIRRHGAAILDLVRSAAGMDDGERPESLRHKSSNNIYKVSTDALVAYIRTKCDGTGLDWQLVSNGADVSWLVRSGPSADPAQHRLLQGWRREFIGDELFAVIRGDMRIHVDQISGLAVLESGT